jgi:hypothetical protein
MAEPVLAGVGGGLFKLRKLRIIHLWAF